MRRYDVIIVGSGPAGAMAAYELLRSGVEVLVLDKETFPRYKPCGGGLSVKVDRILPFPIGEVVENVIHGVRLTYRGEREILLTSNKPVAYMIMRDRFDQHLSSAARKAGATILEGKRVLSVETEGEGFQVRTPEGDFFSRYLIGADGVHSQVRRALFPHLQRKPAAGVEWEVPVEKKVLQTIGSSLYVDFGEIPFGYGWVFPKAENLSIGIAGFKGNLKSPRKLLTAYVRQQPFYPGISAQDGKWVGYPIPVFRGETPLSRGNALLTGDAGGLVDPFFGEGIYYAMRSGQMAAEAVAGALRGKNDLSLYDRRLASEIYPEFRAAGKLGHWVYSFPRLCCRVISANRELAELYFDALREEGGYQRFWRELKPRAIRVLGKTVKKRLRRVFGGM
jgi:geranylgeranyl reductase family protein